ncbi:hypothetical protein D3C77_197390 [compost metagenome]
MTTTSVSGVFPLLRVGFLNLTQPRAAESGALRVRVSSVSGLLRAQAYTCGSSS